MVIEVESIYKNYADLQALSGISLQVERRELFGLIGPDGAGKSTLFRILTTLLTPDSGSARIFDLDVVEDWRELRPLLGYMPGRFSLYPDLSVKENLEFFASIFGVHPRENYDLIRPAYRQLEPFEDRRAQDLSGGMKQKLALSCALIHRPRLLVLDEPTTGVDAVSRNEFWQMLKGLKEEDITIIVATPYMDEASSCDRVALMQKGNLLQVDRPQAIATSFDKELFAVRSREKYRTLKTLKAYDKTFSVHPFGDAIHLALKAETVTSEDVEKYLNANGISDVEVSPIEPSIEDRFMDLIQQQTDATRN